MLGRDDGFRILVDRLWPRGLSKDKAKVDLWLKGIGPRHDLRKWNAHDPKKWVERGKLNNAVALRRYIKTKAKEAKQISP